MANTSDHLPGASKVIVLDHTGLLANIGYHHVKVYGSHADGGPGDGPVLAEKHHGSGIRHDAEVSSLLFVAEELFAEPCP